MPTNTFPAWWKEDVMLEMSDAARNGASYSELAEVARVGACSNIQPKIKAWVKYWKAQPGDRPQAQFARLIDSYDPSVSKETVAREMVQRVIKMHLSTCECGRTKDHPHDDACRECSLLDTTRQG